ncbi:MAG: ATP-binding protein [Chlorobiaceae bacterium]|nr:ATP-binding protein [Chlorobiaceae bacterium]
MSVHRLAFGSDIVHCGALRRCVQAFGSIEGHAGDFIRMLELAVHEAFVNAVIHANGSDPALPVSILLRDGSGDGGRFLEVEVADCGSGFALDGCLDFSEAGDARKLSGRGLPLIARGVESVRVERRSGGSVLILRYIAS